MAAAEEVDEASSALPPRAEEMQDAEAIAQEADIARRALEKCRTQLKTLQGEKSKSDRELRAVRGKMDGLRGQLEATVTAKRETEAELAVQQAAGQAMLLRLQARASECSSLQQQLSVRGVELLRRREEGVLANVTFDLLRRELRAVESWGEAHAARAEYHLEKQQQQQQVWQRKQQPWAAGAVSCAAAAAAVGQMKRGASPPQAAGRACAVGDGARAGTAERGRPAYGGAATANSSPPSAEARLRPARARSASPR